MASEERACFIVAGKKSLVHISGHAGTDVMGARRKPSHLRREAFHVSSFFTVRLQPSFLPRATLYTPPLFGGKNPA